MAFKFPRFSFPFFERNIKGDSFYQINQFNDWGALGDNNLLIAQNHPILTPAILFVSKLFSQARFYIEDKRTGKRIYDHPILKILKNPNYFQTHNDFLETLQFMTIAQGKSVVYIKRSLGFNDTSAMYILNPDLIEWPDDFENKMLSSVDSHSVKNKEILYDRDGQNTRIKIKDLLFFYDLPNCLNENFFENRSRIDGLKQTLINTQDSLIAKNIILKTNGKELITGSKDSKFPLSEQEKEDAETLLHLNYGLAKNRKRGLVTKANLNWQSLHIALRDLGLDESVKVDGNLIYTALHIPKDILSLEAKKTTYNNFKESMVSYIQNEMQSTVDSVSAVFQKLIPEEHLVIKGTYEHLPIMQFILIERYDGLIKKGQALSALRSAGLPDELALEECGFDSNITLNPLQRLDNGNEQGNTQGTQTSGNQENEGEEDENDNE